MITTFVLDPVYRADKESVVGYVGGSITVRCSFAGYNYPLLNLTKWYSGSRLLTSDDSNITIDTVSHAPLNYLGFVNTSLTINSIALSDAGIYTCESRNCAPDCYSRSEGTVSVSVNRK